MMTHRNARLDSFSLPGAPRFLSNLVNVDADTKGGKSRNDEEENDKNGINQIAVFPFFDHHTSIVDVNQWAEDEKCCPTNGDKPNAQNKNFASSVSDNGLIMQGVPQANASINI